MLLLVFAGCVAGTGIGGDPTPSVTEPPPSATGCASWVSFYGLDSPGDTAWAPDRVAVGYSLDPNADVVFVVFESGIVLGTTEAENTNRQYAVTADGDGIPLTDPLDGTHTIRVAAFEDTNDNGRYDRGVDRPCRSDGEPVRTGLRQIDFSSFAVTEPSDGSETP